MSLRLTGSYWMDFQCLCWTYQERKAGPITLLLNHPLSSILTFSYPRYKDKEIMTYLNSIAQGANNLHTHRPFSLHDNWIFKINLDIEVRVSHTSQQMEDQHQLLRAGLSHNNQLIYFFFISLSSFSILFSPTLAAVLSMSKVCLIICTCICKMHFVQCVCAVVCTHMTTR